MNYHKRFLNVFIKKELPQKSKIRDNKILLVYVQKEDSGLYKCTDSRGDSFKFKINVGNGEKQLTITGLNWSSGPKYFTNRVHKPPMPCCY